ncbi:hypothetical protein [Mariprofundus sp. KV]|uniref:DUF6933 domain-containing protein n=1 Tax=Mariprofundus sp. KV TaxID=2608715 RepID=UPI0015A31C4B|nr:hypothetical protein [Mariprofundus sp. KV]
MPISTPSTGATAFSSATIRPALCCLWRGWKKEHFARLDFWFHDLFANTLLKQGCDTSLIEKTHPLLTPLRFDTSCDRSVQGSMRTARMMELESMLCGVPDVINLLPYNTSAQLNHRPVTVKGMKASECLWPDRDMKAWLETVTGAGLY